MFLQGYLVALHELYLVNHYSLDDLYGLVHSVNIGINTRILKLGIYYHVYNVVVRGIFFSGILKCYINML